MDNRSTWGKALMVMSAVRAVFVLFLVALSGVASAKNEVKDRINHSVGDALKDIKATKAQKQQVKAAMQEVATASEAAVGPKMNTLPELEPLLRLFAQPTLDVAALDKIRDERNAKDAKVADALEHAFVGVHAALDKPARERLIAWWTKRSGGRAIKGFQKKLIIGIANAYIDDLLDTSGCTDEEKEKAHVLRDKLFDAAFDAYGDPDEQHATVTALFVPDAVDEAGLHRFRKDREDKLQTLTKTVEDTLVQLHEALAPAHRSKLAELIHERTQERHVEKLGSDAFQ